MHDLLACRHINPAVRPDVSKTSWSTDTYRHAFDLICDPDAQEIGTTASRLIFAVARAGAQQDPSTAAVLSALQSVAQAHPGSSAPAA